MSALATVTRALLFRVGMSVVILLVALAATAAATVGPTYYGAAKHSILQDDLRSTTVVGRGYSAVETGAMTALIDELAGNIGRLTDKALGGRAATERLFDEPVLALETNAFFPRTAENLPLVWRTDVCHHLRFMSGSCPQGTAQVAVEAPLAALNHWRLGQRIKPAGRPALTISAFYTVRDINEDYWFARGNTYFPREQPTKRSLPYDAMFTTRAALQALPSKTQGTAVVARTLDISQVRPDDVDRLAALDPELTDATDFGPVVVSTALAGTAADVHASWSALAVPVVVVTAELLVLTWLLLFLVVTDAVEARGGEVALAKLRGYGAGRTLLFGLAEPVAVLVVALPVGAVLGWAFTHVLSGVLLRRGTPVQLGGLGWAAAAVAALGGVAAVAVAARRTLVRPVVEQWRRTGRRAADRGWVFDAVVLTGAVAGLVQLAATGTLASTSSSALALLVPGLLGLALAVVGSRLLPMLARASFGRTRAAGGLGPFLAARHIARRPGGTRTTMILATAVALATFSLAAWSTGVGDRRQVADATVGAPAVITVAPPPATDIAALVDRIDPSGRRAAAVKTLTSQDVTTLAVQPRRFAAVAHWDAARVDDPVGLIAGLHPPAPEPIVLDGDQARVHLFVPDMHPFGVRLTLDVVARGATAPTPVDLGVVRRTGVAVSRTGSLSGCPCTVADLAVTPAAGPVQLSGTVELAGIDTGSPGRWSPVADVTEPARWLDTQDQQVQVGTGSGGALRWTFVATASTPPVLRTHDRPEPLPAVVTAAVAGGNPVVDVPGLNSGPVQVRATVTPEALPAAGTAGALVDLTYAERAAAADTGAATTQVWVRGDVDRVRRALVAADVPVLSVATSSELDDTLSRQGPGLASVLFLADAAAAALLAALAAVLSLSAAARRRRYEYAALAATGASTRTLYAALAIEQLAVVGFGVLTGVAAGLVSLVVAGRNVPEFVTAPAAALVDHSPSVVLLVVVLGAGALLLLGVAAAAAAALLRSVSADQLRESPS